MPAKGHASRMGGNCWSRDRTVRLLLSCAQGECRPSWAPPISMHTLSSAVERPAISCRAHCLLGRIDRLWDRRGKPSCWFGLTTSEHRQTPSHAMRRPAPSDVQASRQECPRHHSTTGQSWYAPMQCLKTHRCLASRRFDKNRSD